MIIVTAGKLNAISFDFTLGDTEKETKFITELVKIIPLSSVGKTFSVTYDEQGISILLGKEDVAETSVCMEIGDLSRKLFKKRGFVYSLED
jgi:hypothetical protein